ncbi:MAG: transaldolase family protein [Caldicoprobacterales bacterium]|jgi:transaldolase
MSENKFLKWMTSETQSIYWHDSAVIDELEVAIKNGAVGVTTNPFLINSTLRSRPEFWAEKLGDVSRELKGTEKVEALMKQVTGFVADKLSPFAEKGSEYGKCCAQTNPGKPGDYEAMLEQAKRYAKWSPNVCIKIPATKAGLKVCEELAALGYNVVVTVSFTVPQVLAIGEAFQRGADRALKNGITPGLGAAVMMIGRLDDYLRDVAKDTEANVSESDIIQAGLACMKRAYKIFNERKYDAILMAAGCRGAYHITELAGARMIMSVAPKIAKLLLDVKEPFEERIDVPVPQDVIDRLNTMPEFRKAYEPDGMSVDEFISYGATNRTLTQFIESGWSQLESLKF